VKSILRTKSRHDSGSAQARRCYDTRRPVLACREIYRWTFSKWAPPGRMFVDCTTRGRASSQASAHKASSSQTRWLCGVRRQQDALRTSGHLRHHSENHRQDERRWQGAMRNDVSVRRKGAPPAWTSVRARDRHRAGDGDTLFNELFSSCGLGSARFRISPLRGVTSFVRLRALLPPTPEAVPETHGE
jgi:hypothetical protein